jgi:hypothetical protein
MSIDKAANSGRDGSVFDRLVKRYRPRERFSCGFPAYMFM